MKSPAFLTQLCAGSPVPLSVCLCHTLTGADEQTEAHGDLFDVTQL